MKSISIVLITLITVSCASPQKKEGYPQFFQGRATDDCEFIGYVESESNRSDPEKSFSDGKESVLKKAYAQEANAVKIVNINKVVSQIRLSAEAYRCPSLERLKLTSEPRLNFNGF